MNQKAVLVNIILRKTVDDDSPLTFKEVHVPLDVSASELLDRLFSNELYSLFYSGYKEQRYTIQTEQGQILSSEMTLGDVEIRENDSLILIGHPSPKSSFRSHSPFRQEVPHRRTILYYPSISIPDGNWLRQSILYWDEIGSIVPETWYAEYSNELMYLESAGMYRPYYPEFPIRNLASLKAFETEFIALVKGRNLSIQGGFKKLPPIWRQTNIDLMKLHVNKISDSVYGFLQERGLAGKHRRIRDWYYIEKNTGLVYMALLAKYLADVNPEFTVTGTDRIEYKDILFARATQNNELPCLGMTLNNLLPIPKYEIPLADIIDFKIRRESELKEFRLLLDNFHSKLRKCESVNQVKEETVKFKESLESGVNELEKILKDASIATFMGSLETLVKLDTPTLLATGAVLLGHASKITELPMNIVLPGLALTSSIKIAKYAVDRRNEKTATMRSSAFSYLYLAKTEGVI